MNVTIEQQGITVEVSTSQDSNDLQVVKSDDVSVIKDLDRKLVVVDIRKVDPITGEISGEVSLNAIDALVDDSLKLKGCGLEEVGDADTLDEVQYKINSIVKVFK